MAKIRTYTFRRRGTIEDYTEGPIRVETVREVDDSEVEIPDRLKPRFAHLGIGTKENKDKEETK